MPAPADCPMEVYNVMQQCWQFDPKERPNFSLILEMLTTAVENISYVCVYVCVCMYVRIYTYVCMYICMYVRVCIYVCMYVYTYVCTILENHMFHEDYIAFSPFFVIMSE